MPPLAQEAAGLGRKEEEEEELLARALRAAVRALRAAADGASPKSLSMPSSLIANPRLGTTGGARLGAFVEAPAAAWRGAGPPPAVGAAVD